MELARIKHHQIRAMPKEVPHDVGVLVTETIRNFGSFIIQKIYICICTMSHSSFSFFGHHINSDRGSLPYLLPTSYTAGIFGQKLKRKMYKAEFFDF